MTDQDKQINDLLQQIAPDATLRSVDKKPLGFSNASFQLDVTDATGKQSVYIVKQYSAEHQHVLGRDADTRAKLEYELLRFLEGGDIPAPTIVYADLEGCLFGSPILVTNQLQGEQILAHPANPEWDKRAESVGRWLAKLHNLTCPDTLKALLPDATDDMTHAVVDGTPPDYMLAYPDGQPIHDLIMQHRPLMQSTKPVIVHGDFWSGNMLWSGDTLTGLLDWENVSFGDAGYDVAYCYLEFAIDGMDAAADRFVTAYQQESGQTLDNLGLCELAIAIYPMMQRAPYLTIPPYQERFRRFVANAMQRLP